MDEEKKHIHEETFDDASQWVQGIHHGFHLSQSWGGLQFFLP